MHLDMQLQYNKLHVKRVKRQTKKNLLKLTPPSFL